MKDWDSYGCDSSAPDDPWDRGPKSTAKQRTHLHSRRGIESHDPSPNHKIGSCGPDLSYHSRPVQEEPASAPRAPRSGSGTYQHYQPGPAYSSEAPLTQTKRSGVPLWLIILGVFLLILAVNLSLFALHRDDALTPEPPASAAPDLPGDVYNPYEEHTGEMESIFAPSLIEPYAGDTDFTLSLGSEAGKEPLTRQDIYKKILPSVVSITVHGDTGGGYATGVILSEDGYILTNQHVVARNHTAFVTTQDNQTYQGFLVGDDPNTDLALLKINAEGLIPAEFATSDEVEVGDDSYAIGNPVAANYSGTFSNGMISAVDRSVRMEDYSMRMLQTTAAVNEGNSGGPLINAYGQVVGIVNMKLMDPKKTIEGMGFAIPSTVAKRVVDTLTTEGVVEHPVIGITCYSVTAGDLEGLELSGIYVASVSAGSDALEQGLSEGDIITHIDGKEVYTVNDVILTDRNVGDEVTLTVYREGERFDLTIELVEQNELNIWDE